VLGKFYLVIDCGSLMFTIFRLLLWIKFLSTGEIF
jgi:hypothetical protein